MYHQKQAQGRCLVGGHYILTDVTVPKHGFVIRSIVNRVCINSYMSQVDMCSKVENYCTSIKFYKFPIVKNGKCSDFCLWLNVPTIDAPDKVPIFVKLQMWS